MLNKHREFHCRMSPADESRLNAIVRKANKYPAWGPFERNSFNRVSKSAVAVGLIKEYYDNFVEVDLVDRAEGKL